VCVQVQVQTVSAMAQDAVAAPFAQPLVTPAEKSVLLIDETGVTTLENLLPPDDGDNAPTEPLLPTAAQNVQLSQYDEDDDEMTFQAMLHRIRVPAIGIFATYLVTLSIFPGFLSEDVQSKALGDWYPILLFAAFACADYVSRWFVVKDRDILVLSTGRCVCLSPARVYPGAGLACASLTSPMMLVECNHPLILIIMLMPCQSTLCREGAHCLTEFCCLQAAALPCICILLPLWSKPCSSVPAHSCIWVHKRSSHQQCDAIC
jgi:hypothetical protein